VERRHPQRAFREINAKKQHKKALTLSRVRPFVLYSLRHTFLTRLGESGCDAWTLAGIAGHSFDSDVRTVCSPSEDAVLFALDRLSGTILGTDEFDAIDSRETASIFLND